MGRESTRTLTDKGPVGGQLRTRSAVQRAASPERDPRVVLGNRSSRVLLAQRKLTVGASHDPLEVEADEVAANVARALETHATPDESGHDCGPACRLHNRGDVEVVRSLQLSSSLGLAPIGAAGGEVHSAEEAELNRARGGGGTALPVAFRSRIEPLMGADFSSVRVHTGAAATQLNRSFGADAFTVGRDIFFRDGMPDVTSTKGARLISHELAHTIQQGSTGAVARCSCGSTDQHVQRHSSFEHLMLGNVKPTDLATVGAWKDAIEQTKPTRTGLAKKALGSGGGESEAQVDVQVGGQQLSIKKTEILHVLLQEMIRLKNWQREPPKESSVEQTNKVGQSLTPVGKDPTYEVYTVMLPQGILCTYGEMNTLGDYFGSVEVLKTAAPKQVWQLLQSVRDETWGFLSNTYNEVAGSLTKTERADPAMQGINQTLMDEFLIPELLGEGVGFEDATLFRISGLFGQLELLTGAQGTGVQDETNKYTPSLGRNACHFVPESWNAWAENHKKARDLASQSWDAFARSEQHQRQIAAAPDERTKAALQQQFEDEKRTAAELGNEALMTNGFGDHFLQDSYAAGHMINKTQIMQFYIEYIDEKNQWDYFKDANWRKVQNIAYGQILAPTAQYDQTRVEGYNGATGPNANKAIDPQSVENRSDGTWQKNFTELGLQVPRSLSSGPASAPRLLLDWFQNRARLGKGSAKGSELTNVIPPYGPLEVRMAVADMVLDGVLLAGGWSGNSDVTKRGRQMASMRDSRAAADAKGALAGRGEGAGEDLPLKEFRKATFRLRDELKPKKGSQAVPKTEAELQGEFQGVVYSDYLEFIQSAFLQKSTNALHDTFCKNGLTVYDNNDTEIGRVYGDDNMFAKNSSAGVAYSGETSQMSRDAIVNILNTGNDGGNTQKAIIDRFPRKVRADVYDDEGKVLVQGAPMSIEAWHNEKNRGGLKGEAFKWIFPSMSWGLTQKLVPGAKAELGTFFTAPPPHRPF